MKILNYKKSVYSLGFMILITSLSFAQQGSVNINQDKEINQLLALKKEINTSENTSDRYKIQIYSGNRTEAEKNQSNFKALNLEMPSKLVYETPNFKIWIGNFRTSLEADRALAKIKTTFPSAFIFKPKKEKE
ncbi:SPOR domain-containing protein [Xanthomarina sp. F1114]|uniref:SPOR domain-containing protein n=1 Tax=Xanthomarina sp. F1114 TaxID=2996019 RepID=UPI00225DDDC4|nr:SPOR domain-containing protein [Xanthomarina sp. F1114]MCX7546810.1 SPOR domain-containing protein [Xanthomarina sp. F1114]